MDEYLCVPAEGRRGEDIWTPGAARTPPGPLDPGSGLSECRQDDTW